MTIEIPNEGVSPRKNTAEKAYHTCAVIGLIFVTAAASTGGAVAVAGASVISCKSMQLGCSILATASADDEMTEQANAIALALVQARDDRVPVHITFEPPDLPEVPKAKVKKTL